MSGQPGLRAMLPESLAPGAAGDPGIVGPGTVVWRVVRERAILLGGPAALLLQVAHPLVAAGVAAHSDFRTEPVRRLRGTLTAMLTVTFGDRAQAAEMAARVWDVHAHVQGRSVAPLGPFPAGTPYQARDPHLAMWVHATLVVTALRVFDGFVRPLTMEERCAYYEQAKPVARVFGVTDDVLPPGYAEFEAYVQDVEDQVLAVGPEALAVAESVLNPAVRVPGLAVPAATRVLATALVPPGLRSAFALPWRRRERLAFEAVRRSARLGLPLVPRRARYWGHYRVAMERVAMERVAMSRTRNLPTPRRP